MSLTSFNSSWLLAFLNLSLHAWTVFLHCFWVTCLFCHHLYAQFTQKLLVHPCRPPATFAWFPAHQGELFLSLENVILENQPAPLDSSPGLYAMRFSQAGPLRGQSHLESCVAILIFALFTSLRILNSTIWWSLQPRLHLTFMFLTSSSMFVSMRSS